MLKRHLPCASAGVSPFRPVAVGSGYGRRALLSLSPAASRAAISNSYSLKERLVDDDHGHAAALRGRGTQTTSARVGHVGHYKPGHPRRLSCACALRRRPGTITRPVGSTQPYQFSRNTTTGSEHSEQRHPTDTTGASRCRGGRVGTPGDTDV